MLICYSGSIATRALSSSPEAAAILKAGNALRSVKGPFRTERREKLACLVVMVKVGAVMLSCCRSVGMRWIRQAVPGAGPAADAA